MPRLTSSPLLNKIIPQEDAEQLYRTYPDLPKNHLYGCPSCGKNRGYGQDGELLIGGERFICNCHDQLQRHKHYLNSGIGSIYHFITWGDFHGDPNAERFVTEYVSDLEANVESGRGFLLHSKTNGTGKTFISTLALRHCILAGYRCYMTTFQNMLASMKDGWKDPVYNKWYRNKIDSAQVLLIDDLGKEVMQTAGFNNDFARQTMDSLFRTRIQQGRPTLITSNLDLETIGRFYGSGVASLMNEMGDRLEVAGEDWRPNVVPRKKGERRVY